MVRTRVGYCGGQKKDPTYYSLGDHTESLQIDFDPRQTTYETLLDLFWKTHNPCSKAGSRQYMSAVFYANEHQKQRATETGQKEAEWRGARIATEILPLREFYLAEDYHQKYMLRRRSNLVRDFRAMYPDDADMVRSTAAARVNGYAGGNGDPVMLEKEIDSLGLSPDAAESLRQIVHRR
ncbi:MAG: peptide-methionine (S)-S-oxide reductase [Gemmataceae bacterium]|nr:peptide-methionine (S)-S-oxide reductase [Gemmataceae bacterium]